MQPKDDIDKIIFNPRLREGGDMGKFFDLHRHDFSIHASAKEATIYKLPFVFCGNFSIHASAKEATLFFFLSCCLELIFNPRLREGGDFVSADIPLGFKSFQSTPPRRRRRQPL